MRPDEDVDAVDLMQAEPLDGRGQVPPGRGLGPLAPEALRGQGDAARRGERQTLRHPRRFFIQIETRISEKAASRRR
jgi:hypothetical protein